MFREKRADTLVRSVEATHNVNLNVRGDMELGSLLKMRGYDSLTQLLKAYRGQIDFHPQRRNAFISFHSEDGAKVRGLRLMFQNHGLELDIDDSLSRKSVRSENESYVRTALRQRIVMADVLICVVGNGTGWRDWVDWELDSAIQQRVPICALRIPNTYGRLPAVFQGSSSVVADWNARSITCAIESAIARGV